MKYPLLKFAYVAFMISPLSIMASVATLYEYTSTSNTNALRADDITTIPDSTHGTGIVSISGTVTKDGLITGTDSSIDMSLSPSFGYLYNFTFTATRPSNGWIGGGFAKTAAPGSLDGSPEGEGIAWANFNNSGFFNTYFDLNGGNENKVNKNNLSGDQTVTVTLYSLDDENWVVSYYLSSLGSDPFRTETISATDAWFDGIAGVSLEAFLDGSIFSSFSLTVTELESAQFWSSYEVVDGFANTGDLLGYLWVEQAPWVYANHLDEWLYLPEALVNEGGAWVFLFEEGGGNGTNENSWLGYPFSSENLVDTLNWIGVVFTEFQPWVYVYNTNSWWYTESGLKAGSGYWVFVSDKSKTEGEIFLVGEGKPYATISSALSEMEDGDTCIISEGIYREHIDIPQSNIKVIGEGRVIITGCDLLEEMESIEINGVTGLRADINTTVYDVFRGNEYLTLARYPDKTYSMTSNEDWTETYIGARDIIDFTNDDLSKFSELNDGYYVGIHGKVGSGKLSSWYSISIPVASLERNRYLSVDGANASSGYLGNYGQEDGLGYIIGAKAVLDKPGEWYANDTELIVIPPDLNGGTYEMRTRLYGATITGHGVNIENIQFKAATAKIEGNDVTLDSCIFAYISPFLHQKHTPPPSSSLSQSLISQWGVPENGTAGVFVAGDGFIAKNCRFSKSWWSGMTIRGDNALVENCVFEDMNWIARRPAGIFSWGDSNIIRYNTFRDLGGSAIEGGNYYWINQYATNNIWEYNFIDTVCQLIVDQGFFYVNHQFGNNPPANSVWRYNVGRNSRGPAKGDWTTSASAYYVDNNSSGYYIHNNIAISANHPMKHNDFKDGVEASDDVWYYNNTFYRTGPAAFGTNNIRDAQIYIINNLAIESNIGATGLANEVLLYENNHEYSSSSVVTNPSGMDFTPTDPFLQTGGVPVLGESISYIGAVDPQIGMWEYGADESTIPSYAPDALLPSCDLEPKQEE